MSTLCQSISRKGAGEIATINLCKNSEVSLSTHTLTTQAQIIVLNCSCKSWNYSFMYICELKGVTSFRSRTFLKLTRSFEPFSPKNQFKRRHFICSYENYRLHITTKDMSLFWFQFLSSSFCFLAHFHSHIVRSAH